MEFLRFLATLRNPVTDFLFSLITHLGEETFFLVLAIFIFWCVDKRGGYYVLITGLVGTIINQGLKLIFRVDRPWIIDPEFKPIEGAIEEATGYSFPSGHTQNIAGTFGAIGAFFKKRWLSVTCGAIIILVAFSRMYLGVHTPKDVGVSILIAAALLLIFYPIFTDEGRFKRFMPWIIGVCALLSLALLIFVFTLPEEGIDSANLESGRKNGATLFGCMLGLALVYPIDTCFTSFKTEGRWYAQAVKLILGLGGVLLIKEGMREPLEALVGLFTPDFVFIARAIRYFLIVAFAGAVWPLTFKFFSQWRVGFMEKFTERILALFPKKEASSVACIGDDNAIDADGKTDGDADDSTDLT